MTLVENALGDVRAEWVEETTPGEAPTNPEWNRFSDYVLAVPGWSGDASVEPLDDVVGSGDVLDHFRGPEEHSLNIEYLMQRFFIDASDNVIDPIGEPLSYDYGSEYTSHTVVTRRSATSGGNFGAGLRQYVVGVGCRPTSGTIPGDPSESRPITLEVGYEAEYVRSYVVHQPDSATTLDLESTSDNDTFDVIIESEDAGTTETVTLNGTTAVTTTSSFGDIDAIEPQAEPEGDITVTDGSGTDILETPTGSSDGLVGTNTDGVDGDEVGIPALGSGSHASDIGTDPAEYQFLGTSSSYGSGVVAPRIHALDLSVEVGVSREPLQGTRRQAIDIGTRTVEIDADTAGEFDSHQQHRRHFEGVAENIAYEFVDGAITAQNCTLTDVGDLEYSGDEANVINSNTFQAAGEPAVTLTTT
ncbi:hypothetical protein OSG_eHP32_00095 [environmental Halophage eHP-32]|nr:hypothetical protein OSG_eHP32_00095 [environmental Halophage eHP-32]